MTIARSILRLAAVCLSACVITTPAWSTNNANVTGTVLQLFQYSPALVNGQGEELFFNLTSQPATACQSTSYFGISPATVPDAQTRKNFFAMLMYAKATGSQVQVSFDSTGSFCDQNAIAVYVINLVP